MPHWSQRHLLYPQTRALQMHGDLWKKGIEDIAHYERRSELILSYRPDNYNKELKQLILFYLWLNVLFETKLDFLLPAILLLQIIPKSWCGTDLWLHSDIGVCTVWPFAIPSQQDHRPSPHGYGCYIAACFARCSEVPLMLNYWLKRFVNVSQLGFALCLSLCVWGVEAILEKWPYTVVIWIVYIPKLSYLRGPVVWERNTCWNPIPVPQLCQGRPPLDT